MSLSKWEKEEREEERKRDTETHGVFGASYILYCLKKRLHMSTCFPGAASLTPPRTCLNHPLPPSLAAAGVVAPPP